MELKPIEEIRLSPKHQLTENLMVGDYLKVLLDSMKKENGGDVSLIEKWDYIVGPTLFRHVFLESFDDGKIVVKTDHPSFRSAFLLQERQIRKRLKETFPEYDIKAIQVY